ncbi:MAG: endolytic transglycosylase MltG [Bacteroidales bacterium]|nr:endolytic transglycosylase MltG [Bacteroidales bacterium]
MKKKTKSSSVPVIAGIALIAVVLLACGAFYYMTYRRANTVAGGAPVNIYHATDFQGLLDSVAASGSVKNMATFKHAAEHMKLDKNFKPGHYCLAGGLTNKQLVRVFAYGWQTPVRLIIKPHVRDLNKMSRLMGQQMEASPAQIREAMDDKEIMEAHGFNKATYLAMFLPDTYEVYWTATPLQLLDRLWKEYEAFWNKSRTAKAQEAGLTREEVITLASIVIEETKYEPEMPTIAGVYINRLKIGMPLQADPTVKYAVNDPSLKRILNKHLQVNSPYNTYKNKGLPPGPITTPTKVAIDAVLNYEHHNYLYFCAHENFNGQHRFATNLAGHLENARRYHSALNTRKKASK